MFHWDHINKFSCGCYYTQAPYNHFPKCATFELIPFLTPKVCNKNFTEHLVFLAQL